MSATSKEDKEYLLAVISRTNGKRKEITVSVIETARKEAVSISQEFESDTSVFIYENNGKNPVRVGSYSHSKGKLSLRKPEELQEK